MEGMIRDLVENIEELNNKIKGHEAVIGSMNEVIENIQDELFTIKNRLKDKGVI